MYLKISTKTCKVLGRHPEVYVALLKGVIQGKRLSYRQLLTQTDFVAVSGLHKFIKKCKEAGLKTNVI